MESSSVIVIVMPYNSEDDAGLTDLRHRLQWNLKVVNAAGRRQGGTRWEVRRVNDAAKDDDRERPG